MPSLLFVALAVHRGRALVMGLRHERKMLLRFVRKVDGPTDTGCWLWTGKRDTSGYGRFTVDGKSVAAHRWFYELIHGPVDSALDMDHLCRVRACVNPSHVEPVTRSENLLRGERGRPTHCPQGHPMTDDNVYVSRAWRGLSPPRRCRTCTLAKQRAYEQRRRVT
jgi:hypothetical protein